MLIRYYAFRNERGLRPEIYISLIDEIKSYFPDIQDVESDRTEQDIATLTYQEYGKKLDILYSGSGLKHFIDILLKVTVSQANVILLDEPEMGLHPGLQRRFIDYLHQLAAKKNIQIFMATHSPVLLNYAESISYYRVVNTRGNREVFPVNREAIHTLLSDMGLRPSDIFNQDICLLVEGASEIVFFEHIIRKLYAQEFEKISVGIIQYGGSAAEGIISGNIDISNIVPAQKYTFWIRDRDSCPGLKPSSSSTKFKNKLSSFGLECHIWQKREIEYYYPREVLIDAQNGDREKERKIIEIKNGKQEMKFRKAASIDGLCVPSGKHLRALLNKHLTTKNQLNIEIRMIIERKLLPWRDEVLGV